MTLFLFTSISQLLFFIFCEKEYTEPPTFLKKIEKKVVKIAKNRNIPSLELTIRTENGIVDFYYNHKAVKKQSTYGIGSTTKFLSAVAIFKLIEDKKLRINDKVSDYLTLTRPIPGFESLTIKNLLNHTSGLADYTKNPGWMENLMDDNVPKTFEEKVSLIDETLENRGSFSYSNTNYIFLQKIVEILTDQPYDAYFNRFYASNGLSAIKMGIDETGLQAFFGQTDRESLDVSNWREHYGFDGGAFTDSKALDRFLTKLYRDKSLLEPKTIEEMNEWIEMDLMTIPIGNGIISAYGNGIMRLSYGGEAFIGHFGSTLKYQSMVFFNTKKNISISMVTNCSGRYYNNVFFQELIPAILDDL
jgi:CubicO group peptidase (beta-lactamase class C family)